jgi:hypothetical protein
VQFNKIVSFSENKLHLGVCGDLKRRRAGGRARANFFAAVFPRLRTRNPIIFACRFFRTNTRGPGGDCWGCARALHH